MSSDLKREQIESTLSEFDIVREIEEGNIKRVFEANFEGERVALKVVPYGENERLEGYTEREIDIMQQIESETLTDLKRWRRDSIGGTPVFVIVEEFLEGDTLKEMIDRGRTGPNIAIRVTYSVLDVLPEFDEHNIVHRDIKPENLMLCGGDVRLLDVGVARMNERETLTPDFNQRGPGTPAYSAPEVLQNDRDNQNVRSDLFSTGIVLFESITGEHPFNHTGLPIPDAIRQQERKSLDGYIDNAVLEQELAEFYERLTESEPADRYRKAEFACDDLEEIINRHL